MTRSTSGSDPSLSCAQPGPTPGCFSLVVSRDAMHHVTRPQRTRPHACIHSPMNMRPQRVHACLLLTSPTHDLVYKSPLYSETNYLSYKHYCCISSSTLQLLLVCIPSVRVNCFAVAPHDVPLPIAKYRTQKLSWRSNLLTEAPSHPTLDSGTPTPNPNPGSG